MTRGRSVGRLARYAGAGIRGLDPSGWDSTTFILGINSIRRTVQNTSSTCMSFYHLVKIGYDTRKNVEGGVNGGVIVLFMREFL